jgi:type IV pilus assembly protein PilB
MLMEPLRLAAVAGFVLLWLYCIQHADRRLRASPVAQPWINLGVTLGGPPVWALLMFTRKLLELKGDVPQPLAVLADWLGVRTVTMRSEDSAISVELFRSDGKPPSGRIGGPVRQAEAFRIARRIIHRALLLRAADVLMDPKAEDTYQVRYRVDGLLRPPEPLDPELALAVVNCFKILSDMDIAERRRAQDGSFLAVQGDIQIKLRMATASTVYGEKAAIRVLNSARDLLPLTAIGLPAEYLQRTRRFLTRSHGMLIVCGPTGSGKSTTLYATLGSLAEVGRNIVTIEDPVEYTLPFASQTSINPKANITFASQMRHVLRQAPDVILVGEIRDEETARIALQASETGHLVFSTLHANDVLAGLIRLIDLGIEPFLVGAGLTSLLAQRLVRVLCPSCRQRAHITPRLASAAANRNLSLENVFQPMGCDDCANTGYKGRIGIFQMMDLSKEMAELLTRRPPVSEMARLARSQGLTTMRQDGMAKVVDGITSVDEVLRVTVD